MAKLCVTTNLANAIEFDGTFDLQAIARSRAQEFHCFVSPGFGCAHPGLYAAVRFADSFRFSPGLSEIKLTHYCRELIRWRDGFLLIEIYFREIILVVQDERLRRVLAIDGE